MELEYKNSFLKDLKKIKNKSIKIKIRNIITLAKENKLNTLKIKKIIGYENFYRIRIGDYRLGISVTSNRIVFIRILHRKDIYKYFP